MKIEQVHPTLRPLVNAFLLKSRHPFELHPKGRWIEMPGEINTTYNEGIKFIDPNYLDDDAGWLTLKIGKDGRDVFCVKGREEVSPRRKNYSDKFSKETKHEKNALKLMLKMVTPYTIEDIAGRRSKVVHQHVREWQSELHDKVTEPIRDLGHSHRAVIAEMQNLKAQGVQLITPEFRKVMEQSLTYNEEHQYRYDAKVSKIFVTYRDEGIFVHNSDTVLYTLNGVYPNFEALPEDIRGKLAFLKMLKDGESISEVGVRLDSKTFWVVNMSARVAKGNV